MPGKHGKKPPGAKPTYRGCACHKGNLGHSFKENLHCRGCHKTWSSQQRKPSRCPRPWMEMGRAQ